MAQYDNEIGFEPSYKTRSSWRGIIKAKNEFIHENTHFEMPALFKNVSSLIRIYLVGFIFIFILEAYATIGVAYIEGVPILVIGILILLDIFLAYIPHIRDGEICEQKNLHFIADYSWRFTRIPEDGKSKEDMNSESKRAAEVKRIIIRNLLTKRFLLYFLLIFSCVVKLYLFFQTYPFYNTYQAYIVIVSYTLGAILHILCTGHVINYYLIFKLRFSKEWSYFIKSGGKVDFGQDMDVSAKLRTPQLINTTIEIKLIKIGNQEIVKEENRFKIITKGILFDEELNELIRQQETEAQKFAVAVTGKKLQTSLLQIK